MASQSSGPLTTFLMFVPLVAVPALAIFGIPEFAPVNALGRYPAGSPELAAAAQTSDLLNQSTDDLLSPVRNTPAANPADDLLAVSPAPKGAAADPFQPPGAATPPPEAKGQGESWDPPANVLRDWNTQQPAADSSTAGEVDPVDRTKRPRDFDPSAAIAVAGSKDAEPESASPFQPVDEASNENGKSETEAEANPAAEIGAERGDGAKDEAPAVKSHSDLKSNEPGAAPDGASGTKNETTKSLTWKEAVKRLNGFGVREFQLEPSEEPNVFHFSCSLADTDRPRVTRRFEAEAPEPLEAVHDVLAQVEAWSKRRK